MIFILGLQSISWNMADNVSHPHRPDPIVELITYFIVLYLQHGRHYVKCKPSIVILKNFKCNSLYVIYYTFTNTIILLKKLYYNNYSDISDYQ